jgi:hypothetical protein
MDKESYEVYGYIVSFEPVLKKNIINYRVRVISPGVRSWVIYMREVPRRFKLGVFARVKVVVSRQTGEEKLVAEEVEIFENTKPYEFVESIIEEISRGVVNVVSGWRMDRYFSLPVTDEEVLKRLIGGFPLKAMCLFVETGRGLSLASIMSSKEYWVVSRMLELLKMIEEYEEESDRYSQEELSNIIHSINPQS